MEISIILIVKTMKMTIAQKRKVSKYNWNIDYYSQSQISKTFPVCSSPTDSLIECLNIDYDDINNVNDNSTENDNSILKCDILSVFMSVICY